MLATGIVAAGVAALAPAASASASLDAGRHCVVKVDTQDVACASTIAGAQDEVGAAGYVWGARIWRYRDFNGDTATFLVPRDCSASYDNEGWRFNFGDLGWWNNRASSVKTFNHCDVRLFGRENFNGAHSTWIHWSRNLSNIGDGWNNWASSLKLS